MYKASLKLPKIHKNFALSFNLIIDDNDQTPSNQQTIREFAFEGNSYFNISGHPYITLDITTPEDKRNGWNTNRTANLNQKGLFDFLRALNRLINGFKQVKSLYYIDKVGKLTLNRSDAQKMIEDIRTSQKVIRLEPALVPDETQEDLFYEGCIMYINKIDFYTYISFNEMEYLYFILSRIDMNMMQLQLLSNVRLYKKDVDTVVNNLEKDKEERIDTPDGGIFVSLEKDTIPDI